MISLEEEELRDNVVSGLYQLQAIKFGEFTLPNGQITPVYVDMRAVISCPEVLQIMATLIWRLKPIYNSSLLCGVPYTALTLATSISLKYNIPMVIKSNACRISEKQIEGIFQPGQTCLVINDVVVSGSSILETASVLQNEGIYVREALVFLDRQSGGREALSNAGIELRSVFTLNELIQTLLSRDYLRGKEASIAAQLLEST
ncbi:phosphoribosyl transferase domain protein [Chlamydia ibidis]|uniref:Orotate phosphoribosyltransferase n=2 Tax=Chlamydia ibidis TaxID=1405396 RepID=S7J3B4_9CHLA|nr:orotate phosphoribosyltransferase [Chlamydia ibidis]EPP34522.1 phosphoribosyl transferase domain protein [Chlamydia ibidis]EQM62948.1 phosphoribosyl transferase domain protein [Chlamydia ibidis 10-1398/6]